MATATPTRYIRGRKVSLDDLPMALYALNCGHNGKGRAIRARDVVFCDKCATTRTVAAILAQQGGAPR